MKQLPVLGRLNILVLCHNCLVKELMGHYGRWEKLHRWSRWIVDAVFQTLDLRGLELFLLLLDSVFETGVLFILGAKLAFAPRFSLLLRAGPHIA